MLVLSRKVNESILIDGHIKVSIVAIKGNAVRLGIDAPPNVHVLREEVLNRSLGFAQDAPHKRELALV